VRKRLVEHRSAEVRQIGESSDSARDPRGRESCAKESMEWTDGGQRRDRQPQSRGGKGGGRKGGEGYSDAGGARRGGGNMGMGAGGSDASSAAGATWGEGYGGGYQAGGYGYAGGEDTSMSQLWNTPVATPWPPRSTIWNTYQSEDGTPYYHNSHTGLTQWDRPAELEPPKPVVEPRSAKASEDHQRDHGRTGGYDRRTGDGPRDAGGGGGDRQNNSRRANEGEGRMGDGGDRGRNRRRGGAGGGRGGGAGGRDRDGVGHGGGNKQEDASEFGPPGCNLFVFHLPDDWGDEDLHTYFAPHGNVINAKVMKEVGTGRSRGFGFVSYEDRVSAAKGVKQMHDYKVLGKRLKVEFKKGEEGSALIDESPNIAFGVSGQPRGGKEAAPSKALYPDDERLIGYLRTISSKNVVQLNSASANDGQSKTKLQKEADAAAFASAGNEED